MHARSGSIAKTGRAACTRDASFFRRLWLSAVSSFHIFFFRRGTGEQVKEKADLIIGSDGAFSAVRKQLMKHVRFNYSQEYIPHGYMELCIPPKNGQVVLLSCFVFAFLVKEDQSKMLTCTLRVAFADVLNCVLGFCSSVRSIIIRMPKNTFALVYCDRACMQ